MLAGWGLLPDAWSRDGVQGKEEAGDMAETSPCVLL